ncbi:MAG TPA: hypothetical protein VN376_05915 [Longilinea sp.]|nr:hypothetical protein [Longilinea sp.]
MGAAFLVATHKEFSGLTASTGIRTEWIDLISWCGPQELCPSTGTTIPTLVLPATEGTDHILLDLTLHLLLQETCQLAAFGCADETGSAWVVFASAAGLGRYNLLPTNSLTGLLVIPSPYPNLTDRLNILDAGFCEVDQVIPDRDKDEFSGTFSQAKWKKSSGGGAAGMIQQAAQVNRSLIIGRQGCTRFLTFWEKA